MSSSAGSSASAASSVASGAASASSSPSAESASAFASASSNGAASSPAAAAKQSAAASSSSSSSSVASSAAPSTTQVVAPVKKRRGRPPRSASSIAASTAAAAKPATAAAAAAAATVASTPAYERIQTSAGGTIELRLHTRAKYATYSIRHAFDLCASTTPTALRELRELIAVKTMSWLNDLRHRNKESDPWSHVHFAAAHNPQILQWLYENEAVMNQLSYHEYRNVASGSTALHVAVKYKQFDSVEYLLQVADASFVNYRNTLQQTARDMIPLCIEKSEQPKYVKEFEAWEQRAEEAANRRFEDDIDVVQDDAPAAEPRGKTKPADETDAKAPAAATPAAKKKAKVPEAHLYNNSSDSESPIIADDDDGGDDDDGASRTSSKPSTSAKSTSAKSTSAKKKKLAKTKSKETTKATKQKRKKQVDTSASEEESAASGSDNAHASSGDESDDAKPPPPKKARKTKHAPVEERDKDDASESSAPPMTKATPKKRTSTKSTTAASVTVTPPSSKKKQRKSTATTSKKDEAMEENVDDHEGDADDEKRSDKAKTHKQTKHIGECRYCLEDGKKCDGRRPKCRRCKSHGTFCDYSPPSPSLAADAVEFDDSNVAPPSETVIDVPANAAEKKVTKKAARSAKKAAQSAEPKVIDTIEIDESPSPSPVPIDVTVDTTVAPVESSIIVATEETDIQTPTIATAAVAAAESTPPTAATSLLPAAAPANQTQHTTVPMDESIDISPSAMVSPEIVPPPVSTSLEQSPMPVKPATTLLAPSPSLDTPSPMVPIAPLVPLAAATALTVAPVAPAAPSIMTATMPPPGEISPPAASVYVSPPTPTSAPTLLTKKQRKQLKAAAAVEAARLAANEIRSPLLQPIEMKEAVMMSSSPLPSPEPVSPRSPYIQVRPAGSVAASLITSASQQYHRANDPRFEAFYPRPRNSTPFETVADLLDYLALSRYLPNFEAEEMTIPRLLLLTETELESLLPTLGARKEMWLFIQRVNMREQAMEMELSPTPPTSAKRSHKRSRADANLGTIDESEERKQAYTPVASHTTPSPAPAALPPTDASASIPLAPPIMSTSAVMQLTPSESQLVAVVATQRRKKKHKAHIAAMETSHAHAPTHVTH